MEGNSLSCERHGPHFVCGIKPRNSEEAALLAALRKSVKVRKTLARPLPPITVPK